LPCDQYIFWFDIPVNDSGLGSVLERGTDLPQEMNAVISAKWAAPVHQIFECSSFDVLHDKRWGVFKIAYRIYLNDTWMIEAGNCQGFGSEATAQIVS
jgi:hypothetical protein